MEPTTQKDNTRVQQGPTPEERALIDQRAALIAQQMMINHSPNKGTLTGNRFNGAQNIFTSSMGTRNADEWAFTEGPRGVRDGLVDYMAGVAVGRVASKIPYVTKASSYVDNLLAKYRNRVTQHRYFNHMPNVGEKLGQGHYSQVFEHPYDPDQVMKFTRMRGYGVNNHEIDELSKLNTIPGAEPSEPHGFFFGTDKNPYLVSTQRKLTSQVANPAKFEGLREGDAFKQFEANLNKKGFKRSHPQGTEFMEKKGELWDLADRNLGFDAEGNLKFFDAKYNKFRGGGVVKKQVVNPELSWSGSPQATPDFNTPQSSSATTPSKGLTYTEPDDVTKYNNYLYQQGLKAQKAAERQESLDAPYGRRSDGTPYKGFWDSRTSAEWLQNEYLPRLKSNIDMIAWADPSTVFSTSWYGGRSAQEAFNGNYVGALGLGLGIIPGVSALSKLNRLTPSVRSVRGAQKVVDKTVPEATPVIHSKPSVKSRWVDPGNLNFDAYISGLNEVTPENAASIMKNIEQSKIPTGSFAKQVINNIEGEKLLALNRFNANSLTRLDNYLIDAMANSYSGIQNEIQSQWAAYRAKQLSNQSNPFRVLFDLNGEFSGGYSGQNLKTTVALNPTSSQTQWRSIVDHELNHDLYRDLYNLGDKPITWNRQDILLDAYPVNRKLEGYYPGSVSLSEKLATNAQNRGILFDLRGYRGNDVAVQNKLIDELTHKQLHNISEINKGIYEKDYMSAKYSGLFDEDQILKARKEAMKYFPVLGGAYILGKQ